MAGLSESTLSGVQEYYSKTVQKTEDFEIQACTKVPTKLPKFVREALDLVACEVCEKYFGCGLILPEVLEGKNILDLGCGAGRDCFMLSKLVGENGYIIGLDMTQELLDCANRYIEYHTEKFGYAQPNVKFVHGYIEKLIEAGLQKHYFDIIVSNCVICLSTNKKAVLTEAYDVLMEGGELYFSDMYTDTYLPEKLKEDKVLWGEGVSGALHWKDLYQLAREIGFSAPRLVVAEPMPIESPYIKEAIGEAKFVSVTYRLYKIEKEKTMEASKFVYKGGIRGCADSFKFDCLYTFIKNEMKIVDGETAEILLKSRFKDYFDLQGKADLQSCNADMLSPLDPFEHLKE